MNRTRLFAFSLALFAFVPVPASDNPPSQPQPAKTATPTGEVAAIVAKGRGLRNSGDFAGARAAFDDALARSRAAKDVAGEALALNNLASVYRYESGLTEITANQTPPKDLIDKSTALYNQALQAARTSGNRFDEAYATLYLGVLAAGRGDADTAFNHYFTALDAFQALDDRYYRARTLMFMGSTTLHRRKNPAASLKYFEQALPLYRDVQNWPEAQRLLNDLHLAYQQLSAPANGQR